MTVSYLGHPIFADMYHGGILSKVWSIAAHNEKVTRRGDSRDVNIPEVVKIMLSEGQLLSFPIAGPMLVGLCRVYSKQMDVLVGKGQTVVSNLEPGSKPRVSVPSTAKRRKRSALGVMFDTPMHTIPEDDSLAYLEDVLFENQPIVAGSPFPSILPTLSRTPISGRKRLMASTPRSSETVFGVSTPTMDESAKRQRRISSLSEVMDTLRGDDGQRRMSGLLGTTGNVGSFHNADEDNFFDYSGDFDTGIDPPESPPMMLEAGTLLGPQRRQNTFRKFMDRKNNLEIPQASLEKEKGRILSFMENSRNNKWPVGVVFARDSFFKKSAHILWYKKTAAPEQYIPEEVFPEDDFQPEFSDPVDEKSRFSQKNASIATVIGKSCSREEAARSFMEILHLANQAAIELTNCSSSVGFAPPSVNNVFLN